MSLFGLFHVAFGLGVLAKDAISDSIDDTKSREKAEREGKDTYLVNGYKMRSTKTGRDAYIDRGITKYDHTYVRDIKTDRIIEDITLKENATRQIKEKEKAKKKGSIFYRTTKFDTSIHHISGVYVCDTLPGYFRENFKDVNGRYEYIYEEGELKEAGKGFACNYCVEVPIWREGKKKYYEDGSLYSIDVIVELPLDPRDEALYKAGFITKEEYEIKSNKRKNYETTMYFKKGERFS